MIEKAGVLILLLIAMVQLSGAWAQQPPVCYFGECDDAAKPGAGRAPPVPESAPTRVPPTGSEGRRGPAGSDANRMPLFLSRNLCIYGAKAVPVKDADTCRRLYLQPSAAPKNGSPVDCGLIAHDSGSSVLTVRTRPVRTVGDCFGTNNAVPKSVRSLTSRCTLQFTEGFAYYRFDMDPARCKRISIELNARIVD